MSYVFMKLVSTLAIRKPTLWSPLDNKECLGITKIVATVWLIHGNHTELVTEYANNIAVFVSFPLCDSVRKEMMAIEKRLHDQ